MKKKDFKKKKTTYLLYVLFDSIFFIYSDEQFKYLQFLGTLLINQTIITKK